MLELLKGDADADDGADKAKEEEQEELQVGDLLSGGVAQKAAAATTGQGETTESSTGTAPTERGADVDPFEAPLRAVRATHSPTNKSVRVVCCVCCVLCCSVCCVVLCCV